MDEVVIIHLLRAQDIAVVFLAEVLGIDPVGSEELLVGHAERLPDGLCDELGLWGRRGGEALSERRILHDVTTSLSERVLDSDREGGKKSRHVVTSAKHEHNEE